MKIYLKKKKIYIFCFSVTISLVIKYFIVYFILYSLFVAFLVNTVQIHTTICHDITIYQLYLMHIIFVFCL